MLNQVYLVHVTALDRCAHCVNRTGIGLVTPAPLPARNSQWTLLHGRWLSCGADSTSEQRQWTRLRRSRRVHAPKQRREAVAEVEIGDDTCAPPEALAGEIVLERLERAGRVVQLERQRLRPSVRRYRRGARTVSPSR